MNNTPNFESVRDTLIDDTEDLKKKSDLSILIQARLYGLSGKVEDKAELVGLTLKQVHELMKGDAHNFSLADTSILTLAECRRGSLTQFGYDIPPTG